MNPHEVAWRALETELEGQARDLRIKFVAVAEALARHAAEIREPEHELAVRLVSSEIAELVELQATFSERRELLARMRSTVEFAGRTVG